MTSQPATRLEPQTHSWPNQYPHPITGEYGITITRLSQLGMLNLRCSAKANPIVTKGFGTSIPSQPNQITTAGERMAVWLGPDETLLLLADQDEAEFSRALHALMGQQFFALNTVSDAFVVFDIEGAAVRTALAKGISIDLHQAFFQPFQAAQTALSHAGITLICMAENQFRLICRTSFSDYIESWLKDASMEFGYDFKQDRA